MSKNKRIINKFKGYYLEDTSCRYCRYYLGKKRGCKLSKCCCEEEKLDATQHGRIKRKDHSLSWKT